MFARPEEGMDSFQSYTLWFSLKYKTVVKAMYLYVTDINQL